MGNCLALQNMQDRAVRIMTMEGKVLEYRAPMRVYEVLSEFRDHAVADSFPASGHMQANAELVCGNLYHLIPHRVQSPEPERKKVGFLVPEDVKEGSPSLRVKVVISKKKLKEMIETGAVSVDELVSKVQKEGSKHHSCEPDDDFQCNMVWKPALKSIDEED